MKKSIIYSFIVAILMVSILTGCTKVNNTGSTAYIGLHMHSAIDTTQIDPGNSGVFLTDSNGRLESLSLAQMYVTNISLRNKSTQQWVTVANSIFLKRIQSELYPVGNVPAGTYDAVRYTIGLGNALNSAVPSSYSATAGADTVLSTIEQAVMWGSNMTGMPGMASGYTFANVQGYDSIDHVAFSYQLGGYGDTAVVTMPYSAGFTLVADRPQVVQYIHIIADYGKLLQNINLAAHPTGSFYSTQPANVTNAANVWSNIINIFRFECAVPNGDC